jgi:hypothetical protein
MKRGAIIAAMCGLFLMATGCGEDTPDKPADKGSQANTKPANNEEGGHSHGAGPHGGAVADWGGGAYHVEFTVNHDTQEATVYVLGSDAKMAAPITAEKLLLSINDPAFQVDLMATPMDGESDGKSSRFVGKHESLGIVQEFAGTISGTVDGKPYAGDFVEEPAE